MPSTIRLLYVTCKDRAEARRIADVLLKEKLAACANIFAAMESSYVWKGKTVRSKEIPLLLKTTKALVTKAMRRIGAMHSYDCPCILEIAASANEPFASWVAGSVRS